MPEAIDATGPEEKKTPDPDVGPNRRFQPADMAGALSWKPGVPPTGFGDEFGGTLVEVFLDPGVWRAG